QEIATDVRGWVGTFRDPGLFDMGVVGREDVEAEALLAAFDAELAKVVAEPVTEAELEKAKAKLELSALQGLETVSGRAENIGFYETVLGDPDAYFDKVAAYRRVTRSDVLRVARRYLVPEARTIVFVHPSGEEPEEETDDEEEAA
ncbi:MAG: insulinase family protein, partial [Polyangiaceae bacterium]|nr:insulinase family protein [Polyangiaceae bacterium]